MAITWDMMDRPIEYNGQTIVGCKSCYQAVALGDIRINLIPSQAKTLREVQDRFRAQIRQFPGKGFWMQTGYITALPDYSTQMERDTKAFHFVSMMMPIRLDTGYTLPVFLFAYWNEAEDRFLPVAYALGDSTAEAPRVLF